MIHDFSLVFDIENPYWQKVLDIFADNEKYPKKKVKFRELHHKFPRSFSKKFGEAIDNSDENLISLTPGQHFIVHWIYWKIAKTGYRSSMAYAFNLMYKKSISKVTYEAALEISKDIDQVKRDVSEESSIRNKLLFTGKKHSKETKQKMSESAKKAATPELCKFRSESRIGIPHPHKGGFQSDEKRKKISDARKGKPIAATSEFGNLFREHFGIAQFENPNLYAREYYHYKKYGKCRWED